MRSTEENIETSFGATVEEIVRGRLETLDADRKNACEDARKEVIDIGRGLQTPKPR